MALKAACSLVEGGAGALIHLDEGAAVSASAGALTHPEWTTNRLALKVLPSP
jgi:hypothetical protein